MTPDKALRVRIYVIYLAMVVFGACIVGRLFTIQIVQGDHWLDRAGQVATAFRNVQPDRGHIYSDDSRLLATSVPEYELRMDMHADGLTEEVWQLGIDSLSYLLSNTFGDRSPREYKRDLQHARHKNERYHLIQRKVDHTTLKSVRGFPIWRLGRNQGGLIIEKTEKRVKPFGRLASRTVGYLLKDSSAVGLEAAYGKWLQGRTGKRLERRLAGGVWMPLDDDMSIRPENGSDIHTTIDVNLEDVADDALETQLRKHNAGYGCVVVMEVATGYVKAIVNLTRDANGNYISDYNYAVGAATEPGSTFKLPALVVALEDGKLDPEELVDTENGTTRYYDRIMRDSHEGGYGKISLQRAFEVSSNVGISKKIVEAYGKDPAAFVAGLRKLGLGDQLGISIPGEGQPLLRSPGEKGWSGVSLPWLSIGYGVQLTPMQVLAFYNGIANNGRLMRPQFVSAISSGGHVKERFDPVVIHERMCSKRTLEQVHRMLEAVVDSGTAMNLRGAHFKIAGKTGTAQIAKDKTGYKQSGVSYSASFVGYFPAAEPKYSCIVVVNAPSNAVYYGNLVAGPIFREIADKIYSNRIELQEDVQLAAKEGPITPISFSGERDDLLLAFRGSNIPVQALGEASWVTTSAQDSLVVLHDRSVGSELDAAVPNVLGMGLQDALYLLENRGLHVNIEGHGMVKRQSLRPGDPIVRNASITIELDL